MGSSCDFCPAKCGDCAHGNLAGSTSCEEAKTRYAKGQEELQKNPLVGLMRQADHRQREVIRLILSGMTGLTSKHYRITDESLKSLSLDVLHELLRFIHDAEFESDLRAKKAARQPWRRP
jgi:hypothetical protein